ncbi:MAG: recombination protein RecR, partial [Patescibacteria group bacterium]
MQLPEPIRNLRDKLAELPSIGPRQATRLAFHLVSQGKNAIAGLARAVGELERVKACNQCFFTHENRDATCGICADPKRDKSIIAIVEKETDLLSLENTKKFRGKYLILGEIP